MKAILNRLINHESISREEARRVLVDISEDQFNSSQIASFLTIFMMRSITLEELQGFRDALLELCLAVDLSDFNTIDLCGTGGDGKDTFNISTLASFVAAGAGVKVAKHGNYGVSSSSGSSNVMEALGIKFTNNSDRLKRCIDQSGICVMHAPLFHSAMKNVAPIRKELGIKTFFNMLGPLVNPSFPKNQMVGVFNLELQRIYGYLFQNTDKKYNIVHALDGYDEISLTGQTKIISNNTETMLSPSDLGVRQIEQSEIFGGASVNDATQIFKTIINGQGTEAQNNVVLANAGLAISTIKGISHQEGFQMANESLESGKAKACLEKLIALSNS